MLFLVQLLVFCWLSISKQATCIDSDLDTDWENFKQNYDKVYPTLLQENKRRSIWEENLKFIQSHNNKALQGFHTYTLKMNKYGDMTNTEFNNALNNLNISEVLKMYNLNKSKEPLQTLTNSKIPTSINWKDLGYVTEVKDQKYCSSGWAFAAIAAIEGQYRNATSKLISFSEQILLDCPYRANKSNCSGGTIMQAFLSVNWNGGAFYDKLHPYKGSVQNCNFADTSNLISFYILDLIRVRNPDKNANSLTELVATTGPVAAYLNAHDRTFQFYEQGVYSSDSCDEYEVNHAVTIVGYDTDESNDESQTLTNSGFYIVKNSYGKDWGMDGYMWLDRHSTNKCGISQRAYSPILLLF